MLGHFYRYQAYNATGVSVTVTIKGRAWKFASDGSRTDDTETTYISAVSVGAGAYSSSSSVDNSGSSDKQLGEHLAITFAPGSSATGAVSAYIQFSTDGGSTWPANGRGILIASNYFVASAASVTINAEV